MDHGDRFSFEIRAVLVTFRGVMGQIRAGLLSDSRESAQRVTARSLDLLSEIGARYPGWESDPQGAVRSVMPARRSTARRSAISTTPAS